MAHARALVLWHASQVYCGICGSSARPDAAGNSRICTNPECGREIYPRVDPAIIVLVANGERCLLGRQRSWPEGRYSTIAGFVGAGRKSRRCSAARSLRGNQYSCWQGRVPQLAALAVPGCPDAGLYRRGDVEGYRAQRRRARRRTLVYARRPAFRVRQTALHVSRSRDASSITGLITTGQTDVCLVVLAFDAHEDIRSS